jgi:hypothetical protein
MRTMLTVIMFAANWPHLRGPSHDGAGDEKNVPLK